MTSVPHPLPIPSTSSTSRPSFTAGNPSKTLRTLTETIVSPSTVSIPPPAFQAATNSTSQLSPGLSTSTSSSLPSSTASSSPLTTPHALAGVDDSSKGHGLPSSAIVPLAVGLGFGTLFALLAIIYLRKRGQRRRAPRPVQNIRNDHQLPDGSPSTPGHPRTRHRPATLWLSQSNFAHDGSRSSDYGHDEAQDSNTILVSPLAFHAEPLKAYAASRRVPGDSAAAPRRPMVKQAIPLPYDFFPPSYSPRDNDQVAADSPHLEHTEPEGPPNVPRRPLGERLLSSLGLMPASPVADEELQAWRKRTGEPLPTYEAASSAGRGLILGKRRGGTGPTP